MNTLKLEVQVIDALIAQLSMCPFLHSQGRAFSQCGVNSECALCVHVRRGRKKRQAGVKRQSADTLQTHFLLLQRTVIIVASSFVMLMKLFSIQQKMFHAVLLSLLLKSLEKNTEFD